MQALEPRVNLHTGFAMFAITDRIATVGREVACFGFMFEIFDNVVYLIAMLCEVHMHCAMPTARCMSRNSIRSCVQYKIS